MNIRKFCFNYTCFEESADDLLMFIQTKLVLDDNYYVLCYSNDCLTAVDFNHEDFCSFTDVYIFTPVNCNKDQIILLFECFHTFIYMKHLCSVDSCPRCQSTEKVIEKKEAGVKF
jgi:hypothetical protein